MSPKGKVFLIVSILLLVIVFMLLNFAYVVFEVLATAQSLERFFDDLSGPHLHNVFILLCTLVFLVLVLFFSIPLVISIFQFFGKIFLYLSLFFICVKKHYKFKLQRPVFAFFLGVDAIADISIDIRECVLKIHFINVPFGFGKSLAFINEHKYCISSTLHNKVRRVGNGHGQSVAFNIGEMVNKNIKTYKIPMIEPCENEIHVFAVIPNLVKITAIFDNKATDASSETWVNNIIVCSLKTLKKRLKGQLHTSLYK